MDAAMEVLTTSPLQDLSMEAVADAAGVGKPVIYTAFRSRSELVSALLEREHQRGLSQVLAAMPQDMGSAGTANAYANTVSAFLTAVSQNPTRWRLILTVPESAPRHYRDVVRSGRAALAAQAEMLVRIGLLADPRLGQLDPVLLAHVLLSFAETLGRLAISDREAYTPDRLIEFATALTGLVSPPGSGPDRPPEGA